MLSVMLAGVAYGQEGLLHPPLTFVASEAKHSPSASLGVA